MKSKDPKTGFTFDLNLDPQILEWIQDELADVPESEMDRLRVVRAAVSVHAEMMCAIGDTAQCRAYLELVVGHFLGAVVCGWCGVRLGGRACPRISHSICEECAAGLRADAFSEGPTPG